jgi:hypothetical protein
VIDETELLNLAITNIRKVLEFNPYKSYEGINSRDEFQQLIARDPAFGTLGLDDERYIAVFIWMEQITQVYVFQAIRANMLLM